MSEARWGGTWLEWSNRFATHSTSRRFHRSPCRNGRAMGAVSETICIDARIVMRMKVALPTKYGQAEDHCIEGVEPAMVRIPHCVGASGMYVEVESRLLALCVNPVVESKRFNFHAGEES
jgi:hypothetical protein